MIMTRLSFTITPVSASIPKNENSDSETPMIRWPTAAAMKAKRDDGQNNEGLPITLQRHGHQHIDQNGSQQQRALQTITYIRHLLQFTSRQDGHAWILWRGGLGTSRSNTACPTSSGATSSRSIEAATMFMRLPSRRSTVPAVHTFLRFRQPSPAAPRHLRHCAIWSASDPVSVSRFSRAFCTTTRISEPSRLTLVTSAPPNP